MLIGLEDTRFSDLRQLGLGVVLVDPLVDEAPEEGAAAGYKGAHERQRVGDSVLGCGKTDHKQHKASYEDRAPNPPPRFGFAHLRRSLLLQAEAWRYHSATRHRPSDRA